MSAALAGSPARSRGDAATSALSWAAIPLGVGLLLSRLWLTNAGWAGATALTVVFGVLGMLSLAASDSPGGRALTESAAPARTGAAGRTGAALPAGFVLATGAGAVVLAAVASTLPGPALPIPSGPVVLALVAGAGVAEEAFFRRLMYGRLLRWGAPVAVLVTAVAFGLLHVPLHGTAALPIDLGAGLFLSWQRWASGTWAVPAATHALANLVVVLR